jgi:prepilin-type N-terminal cleavage/methylation domain-containing protein
MNIPEHIGRPVSRRVPGRKDNGFTIPEFMITMAVSVLVMGGIITCHMMGLRMFEMTRAKLGASDDARRSINLLISELRSAKIVRVGSGGLKEFIPVSDGTAQIGSAIEVCASTNTNYWVRYYWDSSDQKVKRATAGSSSATVVASSVSNSTVFSVEDFSGAALTNDSQDYVVGLNLQFYQLQYPSVPIGPGQLFDYYQLQTRVTPRAK